MKKCEKSIYTKVLTDEDFGLNSVEFNNPKIRYAARGIVKRQDGKIAIFNKKNKNEYKLPGGGINSGESPEAAFLREALEEIGCKIKITKKLCITEENKSLDNFKQKSYVFVGEVVEDTKKLNLTSKEKDEGGQLLWVSELEALNLITKCMNDLKASKYESLYHSRFIVLRDSFILEYYLNNK